MINRHTAAPDIAGCVLLLFAGTLFFAVLHGFYSSAAVAEAALPVVIYGALLAVCVAVALGIFKRQGWARAVALVLFVFSFICGAAGFHVPETAQLPTGILSLLGAALLLASGDEFAPAAAPMAATARDK